MEGVGRHGDATAGVGLSALAEITAGCHGLGKAEEQFLAYCQSMDEMDGRLLGELQRDGRVAATTLARKLGVPRSTVQERMRRLQAAGIVLGYRAVVDPARLGKPSFAYILASFQAGSGASHRRVVQDLLKIDGIERVDMISGEWDIILRVRGASLEAIGAMIVDKLRTIPSIARTLTLPSFFGVESGPAASKGPAQPS
jgi:DNA-binding Lrp family transcriptional regulator